MTVGRGAVIFGCEGPALSAWERGFYREVDPFGFILFARNVETPDQLRRLTGDLRDAVGRDAPVLVDQEGGRVQRLRAPHWQEWDPPFDAVARAGSGAARVMKARAMVIGAELMAVGIDANCAPVADVVMQGAGYQAPNPAGVDPNFPQPQVPGVPPVDVRQNTSPEFPPIPQQAGTGMNGIETATPADNLQGVGN